jgi:hypothetical protein
MLSDSNETLSQKLEEAMRNATQQLSKELIRESLLSSLNWEPLTSFTGDSLQSINVLQSSGSQGVANAAMPAMSVAKGSDVPVEKASILDGFLISPILKGLIGLFRGAPEALPVNPPKYMYPFDSRSTVGAEVQADGSAIVTSYDGIGVSQRSSQASSTVNIKVDALDARSIMDRSDDIAAAIRQAVLSNSALNDSLGEI